MDRITILKRENLIWIIYVIFAIFGIRANNLEIEDLKNGNNNNRQQYRTINISIIIISLIIYIYFISITYGYYKERRIKATVYGLIGSILIFIAGTLFLLAELSFDEENPNTL